MKKISLILLCILLCFSSIACIEINFYNPANSTPSESSESTPSKLEEETPAESPAKPEPEYDYYDVDLTVEQLLNNIKKSPAEYNNKQVTITGTICLNDDEILLASDYRKSNGNKKYKAPYYGVEYRHDYQMIEIKTAPSALMIIENGAYVEVVGTVKIERNTIYLNDCSCTIINTVSER